ncbi:MAG: DNA alkylation repair protein [Bacteroidota bacterium]
MVTHIQKVLEEISNPEIAIHSQRFFKTGPGEYGEGDIFRGIRVPEQRKIAKRFKDTSLTDVETLLHSPYHEDRLVALLILVEKFKKKDDALRQAIYDLYLENTAYINNWDLVDSSAHKIVGPFLENRDRSILYKLVKSPMLWERRIAMMCTYHFIKKDDYADTLQLAEILLNDKEDLIHKVVGWMLRELGKRNFDLEDGFLLQHYKKMPRTMLRYAIEKFPEERRQGYLKGTL